MSTNSEEIVMQIRADFDTLLAFALNPSPEEAPTVYELEGGVFGRLLALGRSLMTLAFVCAAPRYRTPITTDAHGKTVPYHSEKPRAFLSLFGKIRFARSYYWPGNGSGWFPLDAALNLPTSSISDRLREWREWLGVDLAYHPAGTLLRQFLGIAGSSRGLSAEIATDAAAVEAYYEQADPPTPDPDATLLVIQAEGKGVPMIRSTPTEAKARLGKGEKTGTKKEAIATAVYTQAPRVRTPQEVLQSLFGPRSTAPPLNDRAPRPVNKRLWATLDGKAAALAFTVGQVERQEGPHLVDRIALTDGSEALQDRVREAFPDYPLVLDITRWCSTSSTSTNTSGRSPTPSWGRRRPNAPRGDGARTHRGETAPERTEGVKTRAGQLLAGEVRAVIAEFRALAQSPDGTDGQRKTLEQVALY